MARFGIGRRRGRCLMNNLLVEFDLITAERISGYLKKRIAELSEYPYVSEVVKELRELKIHIDGDLNSMLNDMEASS